MGELDWVGYVFFDIFEVVEEWDLDLEEYVPEGYMLRCWG
jgi:hypothetical protein